MKCRRFLSVSLPLAVSLFAASAFAAPAGDLQVHEANLDGDAAKEEVRVEDRYPETEGLWPRYRVRISDTCPDGSRLDVVVSENRFGVDRLSVVGADTRPGKEVFFVLSDVGRGAGGDSGLVAWRKSSSGPCRRPRMLFRYPRSRPTQPPPGAEPGVEGYSVALGDYAPGFRGEEIRLEEEFADGDDPTCCPSIVLRTYYRYDPGRDEHVPYRTVVEHRKS